MNGTILTRAGKEPGRVHAPRHAPRQSRVWITGTGAVLALALLLQMSGTARASDDPQSDAYPLTDENITTAIENELLVDPSVRLDGIDVSTKDGVVTLLGTAPSLLAADRAVKIAMGTVGTRSVIDQLAVLRTLRTDSEIVNDVEGALLSDPATRSFTIEAKVDSGWVTLTGTVDSWAQKFLCGDVARGIAGVLDVDNNIEVDLTAHRDASEIVDDITRSWRANVWIDDRQLDVHVDDGTHVVVSGSVPSALQKEMAVSVCWVAGVESVDARAIQVRWEPGALARDERPLTDEMIRAAVVHTFELDPRLGGLDIHVRVEKGVVVLRGIVDNLKARNSAALDANNTKGVWQVKNYLRIRPAPPIDAQAIAGAVLSALARDPYLGSLDPTIEVNQGRVILSGAVYSEFEKARAADLASRIIGVIDVVNLLDVRKEEPQASDWAILRDVESELFWSPFVDASDVHVTVEGGVATLTGSVKSWQARNAATENAIQGGARRVINKIDVPGSPLVSRQ
ncbi:MAG: BON domain-containing protein [Candidatus Eiseniibacteriota bacterium]|jgi:osmotically-inducible protein OsmY